MTLEQRRHAALRVLLSRGLFGIHIPTACSSLPPAFSMPPPRRNILCADDHEQIAMLMKRLLERAGHHVESVTDGQEAWRRLSQDPTSYDFVVTDHQMPNLSGLQLVEKLRATGFSGKIIIQTCQLSPPEENAFRALAVDRILRKPGELLRLVEIVNTDSAVNESESAGPMPRR